MIENSPEYRKSIANYLEQKDASIEVVARKIAEVDARLVELGDEKQQLDKRLSFLLKGGAEMAESFRDEYQKQLLALRNEEHDLEHKKSELKLLQRQVAKEQEPSKNGKLEQIKAALGYIRKKDFVALKSIYKQLFEKIVVRPLDNAKVQLEFVFNKATSSIRNGEVAFCTAVGLVELEYQQTKFSLNPKILIKSITCITYLPIPEALLKQKYLENLLSMREIAEEFSCSKTRIRDLLLKHNIPLRASYRYHNRWYAYGKRRVGGKTIDHKGELRTIATIKQMYGEGMNTSAIARCLNTIKLPTKKQGKGWHQNTVAKVLKKEGVYVEGRRGRGRATPSILASTPNHTIAKHTRHVLA